MMQNMFDQVAGADILIVDDTPDNIRFLSSLLTKKGYKVRKALNGKMALIAAKTLIPDLILLDINMPEMDGYEVCRRLKSDEEVCSIPIIFLSAWDHAEDKVKAFQAGGIDYITKPFHFEEVLIRIQNQLTLRNSQKQIQTQNSQLKKVVETLSKKQVELMQSERTRNIMRLAIGIVNGVEQPLLQISNHLTAMQESLPLLSQLNSLIQNEMTANFLLNQFNIKATEFNTISSGFEQSIHSIQVQSEHLQAILTAIHHFANPNAAEVRSIDVHDMIDHILLLLKSFLIGSDSSVKIELVKNYGNLPLVTCSVNLLNQVIFNLLIQAIDRLESKSSQMQDVAFQPTIWIKTEIDDQKTVQIHIQDNGIKTQVELPEHLHWSVAEALTNSPSNVLVCQYLVCQYIVEEIHQGHLRHQMLADSSEFVMELPVHWHRAELTS